MIEITSVGWLVIPLGFIVLLLPKKYSYYFYVVSLSFYVVTILKLSSTETSIKAYHYFSLILVLKNFNVFLYSLRYKLNRKVKLYLILFVLVIILSLIMPFVFEGQIYRVTMNTSYSDYTFEPLRFTQTNITQIFYPLVMIINFPILVFYFSDKRIALKTLRILSNSSILIFITGIFYQFFHFFGLRNYVDEFYIFFTGSFVRELEYIFGNFPRMYSLAGEPGYTSIYFLPIFAFSSIFSLSKLNTQKNYYLIIAIISFFGIVLSGGTTGIFGLMIYFIGIFLFVLYKQFNFARIRVSKNFIFMNILIGVTLLLITYLTNESFWKWLYYNHLVKIEGEGIGSGYIRMLSFTEGIRIFLKSPILGIGYGSHRALQLIIVLLANIGGLGTIIFFLFNYSVFKLGILRKYLVTTNIYDSILVGLILALFTYFFTSLVAKSLVSLHFPWYWLILAAINGFYNIKKEEVINSKVYNE